MRAWIVTSSAVVGSSAISSSGPGSEPLRDHHALLHAAGQLVRIPLHHLSGVGDARLGQRLDDTFVQSGL